MKPMLILALLLGVLSPAIALERPSFDPEIGTQVDLKTPLTNAEGRTLTLGQWLAGRPGMVLFGYHNCPNLCGVAQGVAARALVATGLTETDYVPLFITVVPKETSADAAAAKARLAEAAGVDAAAPWQFLTGPGVEPLSASFGIGTLARERIEQFVHPVALFALTPDGRVARVLPGLDIKPNDLRLALIEASAGKLGSLVDHIVLFCAGFDSSRGQYSSLVEVALRWASVLLLALGVAGIGSTLWRERH
ncbi:MAG TPA: SCO family protein [Devosia sp.]|nr:SCO family protein [Devosia sp.]